MGRLLACLLLLLGSGCSEFKGKTATGEDDAGTSSGGDASVTNDAAVAPADAAQDTNTSDGPSGPIGPGPRGAMPTGYCCTSNEECRSRRCADFGGVKVCSDNCRSNGTCEGVVTGWHCDRQEERCEPDAAPTCIPSSQFVRGTRVMGDCCTATGDGRSGLECEGGHCGAFGNINNPYVCTHVCTKQADCPGNWICASVSDYSICAPLSDPYTCK